MGGNMGLADGTIPTDNRTLWIAHVDSPVISSPVVANGRVYVGTMGGSVLCLSATTGVVLWEFRTGGAVESTPTVNFGRVYVGSDDGRMYCLDAYNGSEIWNVSTGGPIKSSPQIAVNWLCFGSNDFGVHCLNATTGQSIWNFSTNGWVFSSPLLEVNWHTGSHRAYIGSCDGNLYCLNLTTGDLLWNFTAQYMPASPADHYYIVIGSYDNNLYYLDPYDGSVFSTFSGASSGIYSSAATYNETYFGDNGGTLFAVNAATELWRMDLGNAIHSSPLLEKSQEDSDKRTLVVGTEGGDLFAIRYDPSIVSPMERAFILWSIKLGTAVSSSPFMFHNRIYVGATVGKRGLIACIGSLDSGWGEGLINVERPVEGAHVLQRTNITFTVNVPVSYVVSVTVAGLRQTAVRTATGWNATIDSDVPIGPARIIIRAENSTYGVIAETECRHPCPKREPSDRFHRSTSR
jgi:outer membrane protein assembly factor BamB